MQGKRLIVMKFGGTSVGNAERFRQCAAIIGKAARHDRIVVVVSAMAGVTDLIFKTMDAARHGDSAATHTHLEKIRERASGAYRQFVRTATSGGGERIHCRGHLAIAERLPCAFCLALRYFRADG